MKGQEIIGHIVRAKMPDREQIREKCIGQTADKANMRRNPWIIRAASVSVCVAFVIVAVLVLWRNGIFNMMPIVDHQGNQSNSTGSDYKVYVPAIELPKKTNDDVKMSMIGLFVYQGRIYTQAGWYYNEDAAGVNGLVGERLGYAAGNVDEWSNQDEYAAEFAGSVAGDVYSVNGYSKQFRLCMKGNYIDDSGAEIEYINFYENLNGIGLSTGEDLFGDRLKLRDNWTQVKYQKHDDWDYNRSVYNEPEGVSSEDIAAFIDGLYSGEFEYVYETLPDFYTPEQEQAHIYFYMNDNTIIEMRLFEGGYAGYQHLGWYFVKMPGEAFDVIFNACR